MCRWSCRGMTHNPITGKNGTYYIFCYASATYWKILLLRSSCEKSAVLLIFVCPSHRRKQNFSFHSRFSIEINAKIYLRIMELLRLEKTSKIIESSNWPSHVRSTTKPWDGWSCQCAIPPKWEGWILHHCWSTSLLLWSFVL